MSQYAAWTDVVDRSQPQTGALVNKLSRFEGPPAAFLANLLETQCSITGATAAAVVPVVEGRARLLMLYPPPADGEPHPTWLVRAIDDAPRLALAERASIAPLVDDGMIDAHLAYLPVRGGGGSRAIAVYLLVTDDPLVLDHALERLELTIGLLALYETRLALHMHEADLARVRGGVGVLEAVNEHRRLKPAAMAFCNDVAARWTAERVAVGFLKGRYVKITAMSHTERFDRKMRLVQDLEAAMEESVDQDVEIVHPAPEEATCVSRAARELSTRHGPTAIACLPLRLGGEVIGAAIFERAAESPWTAREIEELRLACELCSARLADLDTHDRWIGVKLVRSVREGAAGLLGPRHTWAKLTALAVLAAVLLLTVVKGPDRVDASFEIKAVERRFVPAPFDGRLQSVSVEPGDAVIAGETVLATLETVELQLQLAAARAERARYIKEADLALREEKAAEAKIAEANLQRVDAEMRLLEHKIGQAALVAPLTGTVVVGDLKRQLGAPLETGDVLFEIALLGALHAELEVPEDRIGDLLDPQRPGGAEDGTLASVAHPGDYIRFEVEHINPVAEVIDQENVFRVRVRLLETRSWLRPGMKGVAKVEVGRRPYGYLWTRPFVNWVRMKLWI